MNKSTKILYYTPRILCVIAILFISLFALDAFETGSTIWEQITAFLIHLIPSFILTILLIIAWKKELLGGILFLIISLVFSPIIFKMNYNMNHSFWMSMGIIFLITIPFAVVGILFIMSHFRKRQNIEK
ncbi:hypothetical protein V8G56_07740 [Gaetbulibacter aquiaggeris]|uniref:DUF7670 domain-containing protein n=1 Tax=Gaetbulibacter aquiaggeris TaxID=1735373 RepID=A0ABW7MP73_9FLAO